jgi:hypothetical protein
MHYLAALDHDHLDNGVFLTALAQSLAQHQEAQSTRSIIVHTDSEYTERIIQTGVMREEATIRSIKDLNKRLVALFADQGVSTIGINPYKRNFITLENQQLQLDHSFLEGLPDRPVLLLSTLIQDVDQGTQVVIKLPRLLSFLEEQLTPEELFIFSKSEEAEIFTESTNYDSLEWASMDDSFKKTEVPDEFNKFNHPIRMTTARDFSQLPELTNSILIQ